MPAFFATWWDIRLGVLYDDNSPVYYSILAFVLVQGLVDGLGCGQYFVPAIAVFPAYFSRKGALVLGIGASGSSLGNEVFLIYMQAGLAIVLTFTVGGVIYPINFRRLQPRIGFG